MSEARESEFKGNPMIVLANGPDDKYPFQFGLRKAKLVLAHVEDIKKFVEKHEGESKGSPSSGDVPF
ncbi:MAG: hypothetical protein HY401_05060 [Elusimicrobia bacterium]|nr:hypothetical protein [Elusimicrobiota bacterium]